MENAERSNVLVQDRITTVPRITANRRQITNQNPDLSFTIDTGGRPYYRVLLTTDPGLFAAARARDRSERNFYDSMLEGLLPFDGRHSHYLVPRAVLRAFQPTRAIYFTVVAYADRNAERPTFAVPPDDLPGSAPSVAVDADLRPQTLAFLLGLPIDRMQRFGGAEAPHRAFDEFEGEDSSDAGSYALDDGDPGDEWEGAGYGLTSDEEDEPGEDLQPNEAQASAYHHGSDEEESYAAAADADEYEDGYAAELGDSSEDAEEPGEDRDATAQEYDYEDDGYEALAHDEERAGRAAVSAYDSRDDDGYDDGFGELSSLSHEERAASDQPRVRETHAFDAAPAMLHDEEAESSAQDANGADGYEDESAVEIVPAQGYDDRYETYAAEVAPQPAAAEFDVEARKTILQRIMPFESGERGFTRVEADGEYEGRFGTEHPAYRRYHLGLTFGAFPFVQEAGTLGQLLTLMRDRDPAAFSQVFGAAADQLLKVTNASGPPAARAPDGLSPRLAPVDGAPLWREPWLARFRAAGALPRFQGAQNELASRLYIEPMLPIARKLGLTSARALALLVDRAVQMGAEAAKRWIVEAVDPVQTPAQQQQALAALGHAELSAFQGAVGLPRTGIWDADTGLALLEALRASGRSPVPIPAPSQMLQTLVRRAEGTPWADRMARLLQAELPDVTYRI